MHLRIEGLWGLLILAADVWAIINIVQSPRSNGQKVLWTLVVVLLPVLGFLAWLVFGPRGSRA